MKSRHGVAGCRLPTAGCRIARRPAGGTNTSRLWHTRLGAIRLRRPTTCGYASAAQTQDSAAHGTLRRSQPAPERCADPVAAGSLSLDSSAEARRIASLPVAQTKSSADPSTPGGNRRVSRELCAARCVEPRPLDTRATHRHQPRIS